MVPETLGIGQQRRVIPEKQETNGVSPVIAPVYCLWKVSRQQREAGVGCRYRTEGHMTKGRAETF